MMPTPEDVALPALRTRTPEELRLATRLARIGALGLADRVCAEYGTSLDVVVRGRQGRATRARHRIWTLLRHTLDLSYLELEALWDTDHSSIMRGVKKCERELEDKLRADAAAE
jgi:chromosomal replication initiation ATPase DnaA